MGHTEIAPGDPLLRRKRRETRPDQRLLQRRNARAHARPPRNTRGSALCCTYALPAEPASSTSASAAASPPVSRHAASSAGRKSSAAPPALRTAPAHRSILHFARARVPCACVSLRSGSDGPGRRVARGPPRLLSRRVAAAARRRRRAQGAPWRCAHAAPAALPMAFRGALTVNTRPAARLGGHERAGDELPGDRGPRRGGRNLRCRVRHPRRAPPPRTPQRRRVCA